MLRQMARLVWVAIFLGWLVETVFLKRGSDYVEKVANLWKCRLLGLIVACIFAVTFIQRASFATNPLLSLALAIAGTFVLVLGAALHVSARAYLGANWSSEARIRPGHRLVRHGPYCMVRHPIYVSEILLALATSLLFESWAVLLLAAALVAAALYQARIEEDLLRKHFAEQMDMYVRFTPKMVPTVTSIKLGLRDLFGRR